MVFPLGDLQRTKIVPFATYVLIALNVMAYFVQLDHGEQFTTSFAATPIEISHNEDIAAPFAIEIPRRVDLLGRDDGAPPRERVIEQGPVPFPVWLTLFTAMFLHGSPLHLAGNMLYLWIFGDNVEEVLGTVRYIVVYLCCGLIASLAQIAAAPESPIPTLGASGAIAGIMGMYLVWFPYNRVRVLILRVIVDVPAVIVIGLWIGFQIWQGAGSLGRLGMTGGVAYLAHVGGAVTGIIIAFLFRNDARRLGQPTLFDVVR
ncbi:MAG: gluP 1 [Planctomycetota bacterium]|nr:gluP 1 [Planctomycetota bacterium]